MRTPLRLIAQDEKYRAEIRRGRKTARPHVKVAVRKTKDERR